MIPQDQIDQFQRDGAIRLESVFEPAWLKKLAEGIEQNMANPSQYGEMLEGFFNDYCHWRSIPAFKAFVEESPAAEIAGQLMQSSKAIMYHEHVLVKAPGSVKRTPWHHDQPYYPINGNQVISLWIPLDPVPVETSLRFVRGSHAWDKWFMPRKFASEGNYQPSPGRAHVVDRNHYETVPQDIDERPDEYDVLTWPLKLGDCLAFNMRTLHGAAGNASLTTSRRAIAFRWLGDDARFAERRWDISPPITGGLTQGDAMECETFPMIWQN